MHSKLAFALMFAFGCRTPESHVEHDAAPPAASIVASASASSAPAGPTKKCGDAEATLMGGAVVGLIKEPASILLAKVNGKRALVLSDPKWPDCDIAIENEKSALLGPFAGAPGSDTWKAVFYEGSSNVLVAVVDAAGAVHGLAPGLITPFGNQGRIESRDVFADGHSILYSGNLSADGYENLDSDLLGFVDGKFTTLFSDHEYIVQGSAERYDVTISPVGATPPTITVDMSTRESVGSTEDGGFRTVKAKKKHVVARWTGHAFR